MQKLEEDIFNFDAAEEQKRIGARSAVRIRSSRDKEIEQQPLTSLTQSYRKLAESVKGLAKKNKRPTTFSAFTREVILKRRTGDTQDTKIEAASLGQIKMIFN